MKKIIFTLLTGLITITSHSQDKKDLTISVSTGKLTSPYYQKAKAGEMYSIDFDYYLTERQILSVNFNMGGHRYYNNFVSTNGISYIYGDGTNAKADYRTFSILYKYKIVNTKAFFVALGTGAGIMTETSEYPHSEINSTYPVQSTSTDLVFPVRLELDYKLSNHVRLGFMGGFFVHPDFPILGYHAGPRFTYVVK